MARKTVITVGLPDDVITALEEAQQQLYCDAIGAFVPGGKYSRALTVEILLRESLERRGFLERQASEASEVNDGSGTDAAGQVATNSSADNACPEDK